jgi:hypothetical protein
MSLTLEQPTIPMAGCTIRGAILHSTAVREPFPHWLLHDVLPAWLPRTVHALPFSPSGIGDTSGKRETRNSRRIFFSESNRERFVACDVLADAFQDDATVGLLEDLCGIPLEGGFLRIEYCLDTDGFWLEPHTDIGAKLLTFLIYLSDDPAAKDWGTDIMDAEGHVLSRARGTANHGLIFVPGANTWHGFARRRIIGVRRSLIVNYVKPEWRSRHELAFPDEAVVSANNG